MQKQKISFFISSYFDGIGVNTIRLAEEFANRGYKVDVLIVKDEKEKAPIYNNNFNVTFFNKTSAYKALFPLIKYLRENRPDVLISGGEAPNIISIIAKLLSRIKFKLIVSIRTHLSTQYKYTKRMNQTILKYLGKLLYRQADQIVAVSKGVAKDVSELFYIDIKDIKVIYNPIVNDNIYNLYNLSNEQTDHNWLKNKHIPVILGVGRLEKQKNFTLLIEAFSEVRKEMSVKLIILGEGTQKKELLDLINRLNLQDDVDLVGFTSNPYSYMKYADTFVLSSKWEGFGNVIVEAMACGMKIVSTDCPSGPSEILDNGKYGKLVKDYTASSLAKAITESVNENNFNPYKNIKRAQEFSVNATFNQYKILIQ